MYKSFTGANKWNKFTNSLESIHLLRSENFIPLVCTRERLFTYSFLEWFMKYLNSWFLK